jgi:RsiW-degrading membrane proteinase PrsW (M82 family)
MFSNFPIIVMAFLGGVIPTYLWLYFWLREDREHPEPVKFILLSFLCGMAAVAISLPLEKLAFANITHRNALIIAWAAIEEITKFVGCYLVALRTKVFDEPVDSLIYMITAALGFAALENTLFIIGPLLAGEVAQSIITGNLRFVGSTLLHTISSGVVGIFIAISFYRHNVIKEVDLGIGLMLAITLHAIFNVLIIEAKPTEVFLTFSGVWIAIIILLLLFEKVKHITKPDSRN